MAEAVSSAPLPPLSQSGRVMVVTAFYPPQPGGSSVLMRNLLSRFDPASYSVVTARSRSSFAVEGAQQVDIHHIVSSVDISARLDRQWRALQFPWAVSRLVRLIDQRRPQALIGVYPDFWFLAATRQAAKKTKTPWLAYMHDTLAEGLDGGPLHSKAARLQQQVFREASTILVMSQGMADLYGAKYGLACKPLEHTYLEPIAEPVTPVPKLRQAFWGGAIYRINARALARVSEALRTIDCPLVLATNTTENLLGRMRITGDHLQLGFFPKRNEYLSALQQQGFLVLALDWPDESSIHEDELATIFPTKTPEYLASGRPILIHCPEHYFLARFFRERRCGCVVSDRSIQALADAGRKLLEEGDTVRTMTRSAIAAARLFAWDRVAGTLQEEIAGTVHRRWGQQTQLTGIEQSPAGEFLSPDNSNIRVNL